MGYITGISLVNDHISITMVNLNEPFSGSQNGYNGKCCCSQPGVDVPIPPIQDSGLLDPKFKNWKLEEICKSQ